MKFYRVQQFLWSITSKVTKDDKEFIDRNLNIEEIKLFYMLSINDQKHSINTAYGVKRVCIGISGVNTNMLVRAALLHDIGKIKCNTNGIIKSFLVIGDFLTSGKLKRINSIKCINSYYNHGEIGYRILKEIVCDDEMLYLIKNHHNYKIKVNNEMHILREQDNKN